MTDPVLGGHQRVRGGLGGGVLPHPVVARAQRLHVGVLGRLRLERLGAGHHAGVGERAGDVGAAVTALHPDDHLGVAGARRSPGPDSAVERQMTNPATSPATMTTSTTTAMISHTAMPAPASRRWISGSERGPARRRDRVVVRRVGGGGQRGPELVDVERRRSRRLVPAEDAEVVVGHRAPPARLSSRFCRMRVAATWSMTFRRAPAAHTAFGEHASVGGHRGQPFVDVDHRNRCDAAGQRGAVRAGSHDRRAVRAPQGPGQADDHFHHLVFLDQRDQCDPGRLRRSRSAPEWSPEWPERRGDR